MSCAHDIIWENDYEMWGGAWEVFSLDVFITCAVAVFCTMAVGIGATVLVALLAWAAPLEALVAAGAGWRVIACGRPWGKKK